MIGMKPLVKTDDWKTAMDEFILKNSSKARISVSYSATNILFDQYHRNANNPVQSNDLIKLPILLYALNSIQNGKLDDEEVFEISPDHLLVNQQGLLGKGDEGKFYAVSRILEAIVQHNDNAASNLIIDRLGRKDLYHYLKSQNFSNLYLINDLDDRSKNEMHGASNFVSSGDLINYQKKMLAKLLANRKGRQLIDTYYLAFNHYIIDKFSGVKWIENTAVSKGANYYYQGENGFVLVILVSNFSDESTAIKLLEEAETIFFSGFGTINSN
jgi:hypothetical protein